MAKTTIRCPECGAAFEIPAKTLIGVIGNVLGEDSGLGDCYLEVKHGEPKKPLRDESGRFVKSGHSDEKPANDAPLSERVRGQGHVKNIRLYRRWILAQLFHMLDWQHEGERFSDMIRARGVRYMWDVIMNEVHDMTVIRDNGDAAEANRRWTWWNPDTVAEIASDYLECVKRGIETLKVHKREGREYKTIPGFGMVYWDEIDDKIIRPIVDEINNVNAGKGLSELDCFAVGNLCRMMRKFRESTMWSIRMPTAFINAFKGNGGHFGLRNLIMFHGCHLPGEAGLPQEKALELLDNFAEKYAKAGEGWRMLGLFKQTLEANGVSIPEKFREWRNAREKKASAKA